MCEQRSDNNYSGVNRGESFGPHPIPEGPLLSDKEYLVSVAAVAGIIILFWIGVFFAAHHLAKL